MRVVEPRQLRRGSFNLFTDRGRWKWPQLIHSQMWLACNGTISIGKHFQMYILNDRRDPSQNKNDLLASGSYSLTHSLILPCTIRRFFHSVISDAFFPGNSWQNSNKWWASKWPVHQMRCDRTSRDPSWRFHNCIHRIAIWWLIYWCHFWFLNCSLWFVVEWKWSITALLARLCWAFIYL